MILSTKPYIEAYIILDTMNDGIMTWCHEAVIIDVIIDLKISRT